MKQRLAHEWRVYRNDGDNLHLYLLLLLRMHLLHAAILRELAGRLDRSA